MADVDSRTLQTAASLSTRITIGGFICAVGFGVLVLAAELLIRSWQGWFAQLEAAGPFAIVAISIWLFYSIRVEKLKGQVKAHLDNFARAREAVEAGDAPLTQAPEQGGAAAPHFGDKIDSVVTAAGSAIPNLVGSTVAVAIFIFGIASFVVITGLNAYSPSYNYFALRLPVYQEPGQASNTAQPTQQPIINAIQRFADSPANGTTIMISPSNAINTLSQSNETDATDGADNIFVWKVRDDTAPLPLGAIPIALGGLLIIAFGIWFPTVELAETKGAMAMSEKLVAPILSIALVALGAGQQADADKTAADEQLVEQGLPPTIRAETTDRIYLEDLRKMNDSSIDDLANSVRALNESLSHPEAPSNASLVSKGGVSDDVNTLKAALNGLEVSIENPNPVIVRDSGDFVTLRANILQAQQQLSIADRLAARANAEASNASAAAGALSAKNMSDLAALCDALAFAREDAKRVEYIQTDRVNSYTNSFLHGARSFFGGKDSQTVALQNDRNLAVQRVSSIDRSIRALNCNPAPGGTP